MHSILLLPGEAHTNMSRVEEFLSCSVTGILLLGVYADRRPSLFTLNTLSVVCNLTPLTRLSFWKIIQNQRQVKTFFLKNENTHFVRKENGLCSHLGDVNVSQ